MIENLISYYATHLKALFACHGIDDHVAMYPNKVLAIENRVLVLASCVYHLDRKVLVPYPNDLAEGILNGWIVRIDEVSIDVLDCEGALACHTLSILSFVRSPWTGWVPDLPTDLLPTMAILRCFCCGAISAILCD